MDVKTLLFARKEEESKGAIPKDRRAHADDDGKRGGARLVAEALVIFGPARSIKALASAQELVTLFGTYLVEVLVLLICDRNEHSPIVSRVQ